MRSAVTAAPAGLAPAVAVAALVEQQAAVARAATAAPA
jgi:hypothetical protein